jgi:hypothetical protein
MMPKALLTVEHLFHSGFHEVGSWELGDSHDLQCRIELPRRAGVYAFAIDGVVQYVGLASTSVRQRLGFYRKPALTQVTNLRLNQIIRDEIGSGRTVQILIAHPPQFDWNGLKISGAEGLEAGLISEFDLPWNKRGTAQMAVKEQPTSPREKMRRQIDVARKIADLVERQPGLTELEIAKAIYGPSAVQQQVNQQCRVLVSAGKIERRGTGGPSDPFTYRPSSSHP